MILSKEIEGKVSKKDCEVMLQMYLDGVKQHEIADKYFLCQSYVSTIITNQMESYISDAELLINRYGGLNKWLYIPRYYYGEFMEFMEFANNKELRPFHRVLFDEFDEMYMIIDN